VPVSWESKGGLLRLTLMGEYTFDAVATAFEAGLNAAGGSHLRVLWDGSEAAKVPDTRGIEQRIALLHRHKGRLTAVAIVGRSTVMFGLARQIAQMLDCTDTAVEAFWDVPDATAWLRQQDTSVQSQA
jgi:hypothetical protein